MTEFDSKFFLTHYMNSLDKNSFKTQDKSLRKTATELKGCIPQINS